MLGKDEKEVDEKIAELEKDNIIVGYKTIVKTGTKPTEIWLRRSLSCV